MRAEFEECQVNRSVGLRRRSIGVAFVLLALLVGNYIVDVLAAKAVLFGARLQLLEERQNSLLRIASIPAKLEQSARGSANLSSSSFDFKGRWEIFGGASVVSGWPDNYERSKALGIYRDHLYVGLSKPRSSPPQVWRTDGEHWERIGDEQVVPSWRKLKQVTAFTSYAGKLTAGIDDTVWTFDSAWTRIGGEGVGWPKGVYANAYTIATDGNVLYVGMHGGDAAVYSYSNGRWEKIAGSGIRSSWSGPRYEGVYQVWMHTDGYLYAGLVAHPGPTAVFRYNGILWEKIGGDGVNGSWSFPGFTYVLSFTSHDGTLIVSMNRHPMIDEDFSSVWAFDGGAWRPVGIGHIPMLWSEMNNYNATASYKGLLLIGAGGHPAGNATVWALQNGRPTLIAGHGKNKSWWSLSTDHSNFAAQGNNQYVYRMIEWRGDLFVGFGDDPGSAEVWRFRPSQIDRAR